MTEEERAHESRLRFRRQKANREVIARKLAGSRTAQRALEDAWAPVILAALESRQEGDDDADA